MAWLDSQDFKIYYESIFGGTTAFTAEAFKKANGYSNQFWGSGGMFLRLENQIIQNGSLNCNF